MIKKQIIGSVLMLFFVVELVYFEVFRSSYQKHTYRLFGITEEMLWFFIILFLYLLVFTVGSFVCRKKSSIFSSIGWSVTSAILSGFALWTFVLMQHPTESEWGGFAQSMIYYLIASIQSQTAISLAMLALFISQKAKNKLLSMLPWLSLAFGSFTFILYIKEITPVIVDFELPVSLYWILVNFLPVGFFVTLILFTSKTKEITDDSAGMHFGIK